MNPIRILRKRTGLTQQALASAAGTSQPTIAAYESGAKSPTLRTLEKLAAALDLEMLTDFVPRMTREDRRSLAFHRAIAGLIEREPDRAVSRARENLSRLREIHPHAAALLDRWQSWLELAPGELIDRLLDPSVLARDMRQVSPFSGLLSPAERARVLRRFRREQDA